ncbi:Monocarboxylate transporter 12 [Lamellibrachia satsuma]|nr:Monocarboxylate transporter 12 [Lamellibrachia satsuma]
MTAKDGNCGWRCFLTTASFLIHVIIGGLCYCSGVLQLIFIEYFGRTRFETSWIVSLMLGFSALAGIPATLLMYRCGYRLTIILGGSLAAAGLALSVLCTDVRQLYLTIGIMCGCGFGLSLTPSLIVTKTYFERHRTLASSVAVSGISIGVFVFPLVLTVLEDTFALKGMLLILAGVCLNICLCGVAMKTKEEPHKDSLKIFACSLFRSSTFVALCVCNVLWTMGVSIIYTYLPDYAVSTGLTVEDAAMLIAISGVTSFFSRVTFEVFQQSAKLDFANTFLCSICTTAILTGLFPELFKHKAGEIGYAIMLGLHTGFWGTFVSVVGRSQVGDECLARGRGFLMVTMSIGLFAGSPLAGWLCDRQGNFDIAFYLAGACLLVSSIILVIVHLVGFEYRRTVLWSDSESESSAGKSSQSTQSATTDEQETLVTSWLSAV